MAFEEVIMWLIAPYCHYNVLLVLEVQRAATTCNTNRGGNCPLHMGIEFSNL
jgi:hypothetical protein